MSATDVVLQRLPEESRFLANVEASLALPGSSLKPCGLDLGTADADFDTWATWGHTLGFLAGWNR